MTPPEKDRARGALLGVAAGDALGWPVENRGGRVGGTSKIAPDLRFVEWKRREGGSYGPHHQRVHPGEVSDDTQLTIAVARSLLRGDGWLDHLRQVELPLWTVYERGGGGATKRSAQAWLRGRPPWAPSERADSRNRYFGAGGNGTAMRCIPHCLDGREGFREVSERLDLDAVSTHGHPRALLGSRVFGWAAWWAVRRSEPLAYGELLEATIESVDSWSVPPSLDDVWAAGAREHWPDGMSTWERAVEETLDLLRLARAGLAQGAVSVDGRVLNDMGVFGSASGAGTITAAAAVFLATRYVSQPELGLMTAAFARGADTDTLAAMTAGLLGCLAGDGWLWPLTPEIQDVDYLARLATSLATGEARTEEPATPFTTRSRTQLYRWLDHAMIGDSRDLEPFGRITVREIQDHETQPQFVRSWSLDSLSGQTLLVKRYDKGRDGRPRWRPLEPKDAPTPRASDGPSSVRESHVSTPVDEPRAGLVLEVADLARARHFYEEIVGLEVKRKSSSYVSYGWLALEPADTGDSQLALPGDARTAAAIRVYLFEDALKHAVRTMRECGMKPQATERRGKPVVRTADPDGYQVEFCLRNGTTPPV